MFLHHFCGLPQKKQKNGHVTRSAFKFNHFQGIATGGPNEVVPYPVAKGLLLGKLRPCSTNYLYKTVRFPYCYDSHTKEMKSTWIFNLLCFCAINFKQCCAIGFYFTGLITKHSHLRKLPARSVAIHLLLRLHPSQGSFLAYI